MSYSPFAVLGTSARIKASKDRMKESQPTEKKEEKKIDYTEQFRKTYFPHLTKKQLTNNQFDVIMIIEREVIRMKTVIIEYAVIDPVTLINKIERAFPGAMARFTDIDEDYFELSIWNCIDLDILEDVLVEYI